MKRYVLGFLIITTAGSFIQCDTVASEQEQVNNSQGSKEGNSATNSIEAIFLPNAPNNKVNYSAPGSSMAMSRYYIWEDSLLIIKDSTFVEGNFQNGEIKTIQIIDNEVHLLKSESFFGTWSPKVMEFNPPQILLKIPVQNESITWTSNDPDKGTITYNANWTELEKNNQKLILLRVEKGNEYTKVKEVDYYSAEVGLIRMEMETTDGVKLPKLQLEGLTQVAGL